MAPVSSFPIKVGHIDDVQELNKAKQTTVPERFVQDMADRPKLTANLSSSTDIPIIDLSKLMKGDTDEHFSEVMKLKTACEEWGFFQVLNHGVDLNVLENMEKLAKDFFMLPLHEKQKYPMAPGTVQGYGQAFVFSENQKLDWCNMFALGVEPPCIRNPKLWPSSPANFREILEMYSREIRELCKVILQYIAVSLGLKGEIFEEMFGVAVQAVRMNYYPPCSRPDLVLGLSPHSDGSALTVLQQGKESTVGLQILKDQTWLPVQPVPNALVVNIGDSLEVLTNGKYKSVEHRAVTHKENDRLSIVTFYAPSYDIELSPMPELVDEKNPCRYRRYNHGEYNKHYVTNKLQGKRTLDLQRSNPIHQINKGSTLVSPLR
ncbi:putative pentatricopeptide repeat-containing protein [Hibiscus syriacus]|uniref:Pentatricopeptide repeat-containing protein n=1 Tax=Hibiscus syriacus TaxID=106335 RepID=A0A6A3D3K2_HIBSY|nr:protein SRG1-like [Hibiscus syriacus]KAE8736056.1 putative pentatricopeptide repeat-containing protein [Hibiscus syriacus]